ncbi:hypothetical protein LTR09_011824 [Extremus antarcticus]|uniref:Uncharacterized protein n=1 Tax=Extremus antarcticus TaxID=702011 RepID=A0AAJ0G9Z6_9PEZI|nr:hypothetical protein LTR09_011824 [Extremus antarcticus]
MSLARSVAVNFLLEDGSETNVNRNDICKGGGNPSTCSRWSTLEFCHETGWCGVDIFSSDEFSVNGQTYEKNDYDNTYADITDSELCTSLCNNYGYSPCRQLWRTILLMDGHWIP